MDLNIIVRGYADGDLIFTESITCDETTLDKIAERHMNRMALYPRHMIEIEFPDEPDPLQRFFRFGTDPSGMVQPIGIDLEDL